MPAYEVEHICDLTEDEQDKIAETITNIHSETFATPKLFVNVRFTNIAHHVTYVAGKRRRTNRIFAHVRHGPSRTQSDYDGVSEAILGVWNTIVGPSKVDAELRLIMYFGSIVAGTEVGFHLPAAGGDANWITENLHAFQTRATEGDDDFSDMLEELKARGLVRSN
ncbi:hypothetical protein AAFC00_006971 [Neodothiora populina]|uniref:Tautomerase cis-CaaD-like domain-containing protein n=1 Tax=Neodothiora populina TaxID=2781224 RepID=A0ABR3PC17_9PEZI